MKARLAFVSSLFLLGVWACAEAAQDMFDEPAEIIDAPSAEQAVCEMCSFSEENGNYCLKVPCEGGCLHEGKYYAVGGTFTDQDGCSRCTCEDFGEVSCTNAGCNG